eukprot:scaffold57931_cov17-Tisochrysis_lutea.AAC.2
MEAAGFKHLRLPEAPLATAAATALFHGSCGYWCVHKAPHSTRLPHPAPHHHPAKCQIGLPVANLCFAAHSAFPLKQEHPSCR